MADKDKIKVDGYERKKPKTQVGRRPDEPHVAPEEGPGIINVPKPQPGQAAPRSPSGGGVTIIGGGVAGRRGDVNVRPKPQ